jgi:membrane-associated PAP2 superfamily phosphatase
MSFTRASPQTSATGIRDLFLTGAFLVGLIVWDSLGFDLAAERWFGGARGFPAQSTWWSTSLLHDGGRWFAWLLAAALLLVAVRTSPAPATGLQRAERLRWIGVMLLCVLVVPLIKRYSATSCPWDLAEFGGRARYVPHWSWGVADGGPGHCFPSGHAVAAFAFFAMYFQWRPHDRGRSRAWLVGVCVLGAVLGMAQIARGAHYVSHVLWSAWACWTICVYASALERSRRMRAAIRAGTSLDCAG